MIGKVTVPDGRVIVLTDDARWSCPADPALANALGALHDFHDYNPTRSDTLEKRASVSQERSKAGSKGAASRWQRDGQDMAPASDGKPMAPSRTRPVPVPVSSSLKKHAGLERVGALLPSLESLR